MEVLLFESRGGGAGVLAERLARAGCRVAARVDRASALDTALERHAVDVIVLDLERPERGPIAQAAAAGLRRDLPVAVFVEESDATAAADAVRAGVASYIVRGAHADRVRDALLVACARFAEERAARAELASAKAALVERKLVERAKGRLMERTGVDEAAAYAALRRRAMQSGRRLAEVAAEVLETAI